MKKAIIIVLILIWGIFGSATAAEILAKNYTSASGFGKGMMYIRTFGDASEGGDSHDGHFLPLPDENELEVFSNEPGFKARINAKPPHTPYAEVDLGVRNAFTGTIDNSLKFMVSDSSGLEHRNVYAYNVADPCDLHQIPKNGDILEIALPDLVNPSTGVYATWKIETPLIVPGDIYTDGKVDFKDYSIAANEWFQTTQEGENYLWSDVNYDRITDFNDLEVIADNWLKDVNDF